MVSKTQGDGIDIGLSLKDLASYIDTNVPTFGAYGRMYSGVTNMLSIAWYAHYGADPRVVFGFPGDSLFREEVTFPGLPVEQLPYDALADYARYSFPLGEAVRQLSPSKGSKNLDREHQAVHTTVLGQVRPRGSSLYTYSLGLQGSIADLPVRYPDQNPSLSDACKTYGLVNYSYPATVGHEVDQGYIRWGSLDFQLLVEDLSAMWFDRQHSYSPAIPHTETQVIGNVASGVWNGFKILSSSKGRVVFQNFETRGTDREILIVTYVDLKLSTAVSRTGGFSDYGTECGTLFASVEYESQTYNWTSGSSGEFDNWTRFGDVAHVAVDSVSVPPLRILTKPYSSSPDSHQELFYPGSKTLHAYQDLARRDLHNLRPSVILSLKDAFSNLRTAVNNWVEIIAEISEVADLVPVGELVAALGIGENELIDKADAFLNTAQFSQAGFISSLRLAAKWIAGLFLAYSFGRRPLTGTIEDMPRVLAALADKLEASSDRKKTSGVATFKNPLGCERSPNKLTTRIRFFTAGVDDGNVAHLFRLDRAGLLPTSSRLWEIKQASWLIDMFINMKDRFEFLDVYALLCFMDAHDFVISYTIDYELSYEELQRLRLESDSAVVVRVYIREISRYIPALWAANNIDSFVPDKPKNWWIILALLIQAIA